MRLVTLVSLSVLATISCAGTTIDPLHLDWLDKKTSPADNFFVFANGSWQKQNPIPADYSSWGAFQILREKTQENIHNLVIKAAENKQAKPGSIEQKVGDFYFSGMDKPTINSLGFKPLETEYSAINSIKNEADLRHEIAHLHSIGVDVLFNFSSMQDFTDSNLVIGALIQDGLGLPDRDYYLKTDKKFKKIRTAYLTYLTQLFTLTGTPLAQSRVDADLVINIETSLAKASLSQTGMRDPHAIYHLMNRTDLEKIAPNFSWSEYFTEIGFPNIEQLNVGMPDFVKTMNQQLKQHTLQEWTTYLRAHLLMTFAPYLSSPFVENNFRMTTALSGTKKLLPRWKRVMDTEETALGFAIGELYVKHYFSPEAKQEVLKMMRMIRQVLQDDLKTLSWMTPDTRIAALKKLDRMEERVGYPDKWRDYSSLMINKGPYVLNVLRANQYLVKRDLDKIGKPVDRQEWEMTPQTINAYYNPSMNSINFPMGILQPPFFDVSAPEAVNYGAIGFVIGHEITHGFDDQGAKFDEQGNLKNWWTPEDLEKFKAATQCIVDQFSLYQIPGGMHVNGELVVGEATADLGGLTLAYRAYHASDAYQQAKTIDGYTPDQQFFLSMAHSWANNIRPEQAQFLVTVDPHPPAIYRVNGTLENMPAFQDIFNITDKSPMVKIKRCVIW